MNVKMAKQSLIGFILGSCVGSTLILLFNLILIDRWHLAGAYGPRDWGVVLFFAILGGVLGGLDAA